MAITVTARHAAGPTTTGAQTQTTSSATPTADSLLLVFFGAERDNHTTAEAFQTPTGGGWTYTQRHTTSAFNWGGAASFAIREALYSAPVGVSVLAHTITVDSWSGTDQGFYSTLCCDVTGHNATTPFAQAIVSNGASVAEGNAHSGSVTLGSTPTIGNVVLVLFAAGADAGNGFTTPTLGGRTMTAVGTPQNGAFYQSGLWQLEIDGTETNNTITCSDVGNAVGNWLAITAEIAVAADGNATAEPATIATLTATPQPSVNITAGPSVTATTGAVPQAGANVAAGPTTTAAVTDVPSATVVADAVVTPGVISATAALPPVAVDVGAAPAATDTAAALPAPAVDVAAGPAATSLAVALPPVTVDAGGSTTVAVATIASLAAVPEPTLMISAGPSTIAVVVALPVASAAGVLPDPNPFRLTHREPGGISYRERAGVILQEAFAISYQEPA